MSFNWELFETRGLSKITMPRCSAVCAYYTPVASRPNLTILLNATVSRIIWENETYNGKISASAVEFIQGGKILTVPVERETIVTGGTIGTPKILELSGIGNST